MGVACHYDQDYVGCGRQRHGTLLIDTLVKLEFHLSAWQAFSRGAAREQWSPFEVPTFLPALQDSRALSRWASSWHEQRLTAIAQCVQSAIVGLPCPPPHELSMSGVLGGIRSGGRDQLLRHVRSRFSLVDERDVLFCCM